MIKLISTHRVKIQIPRAPALIALFCGVQSLHLQQKVQVTHTLKSLDPALINGVLVWPECSSPPRLGADFKASIGRSLGIRSETSYLHHGESGNEPAASQLAHERVEKVIKSVQS